MSPRPRRTSKLSVLPRSGGVWLLQCCLVGLREGVEKGVGTMTPEACHMHASYSLRDFRDQGSQVVALCYKVSGIFPAF